ncbi:hypothetical protein KBY66_14065 [Synechococcus sp. Tobar12-5m-g]|uniref:hypothetical protein n=1 Tax=unclassified Synechococcus TaxID=2626047 RepID=UPI0020CC9096|nr:MULTISPECIES: hypothetical protein [unclassified Synechococcus]MCP9773723.1 hypothetical protein [Synechococcus sp. Tobar12-5m-g]MCP9874721.1 hypothetical protein [Synechococcus sp. Cruz CV-v-12]
MAVTKVTYTAAATWTAFQLANIFRDAFIDAGLMTAWFDTFLSGSVENRVLEITYNGSKTHGKTYYWFQFTTTGVFVHIATSWNAGSDIPSGTAFLDHFATTTNATSNHLQLLSLSTTTTTTLTRYTSVGYTMFLLQSGSTNYAFLIAPATAMINPLVDLDRVNFHHFLRLRTAVNNNTGRSWFENQLQLRRSFNGGRGLRGSTNLGDFISHNHTVMAYGMVGNANNSAVTNLGGLNAGAGAMEALYLPIGYNNTNPAYGTDVVPVFRSPKYSLYLDDNLPADFGVAAHYANNTMAVRDTLVVSAGVEEWEIIQVTNSAAITTGASPCILARTVG